MGAKRVKDGTFILDSGAFSKALGVKTKPHDDDDSDGGGSGRKKGVEDEYKVVEGEVRKLLSRRPKALGLLRSELVKLDKKGKGKLSREDVRFGLDEADIELSAR